MERLTQQLPFIAGGLYGLVEVGDVLVIDSHNYVFQLSKLYTIGNFDKYDFRVKKVYNEPGERILRKAIIGTLGKVPVYSIASNGRRMYHI